MILLISYRIRDNSSGLYLLVSAEVWRANSFLKVLVITCLPSLATLGNKEDKEKKKLHMLHLILCDDN